MRATLSAAAFVLLASLNWDAPASSTPDCDSDLSCAKWSISRCEREQEPEVCDSRAWTLPDEAIDDACNLQPDALACAMRAKE